MTQPEDLSAVAALRTHGEAGCAALNSLEIAYWRAGHSDKTIVFLHGNSAGKEAFHEQFAGLANAGYALLAIDLPGHGSSSNSQTPVQDYTFCGFALMIKRVLAQLQVSAPLVVGWSLGGHVAIEMAGRGYDLSGILVCGTPPMGPGLGPDFNAAFLPSPAMAVTMNPAPTEAELATYVQALYGTLDPLPPAFHALAARMDGAVRSHMAAHWAAGDEGCHQRTVVAGWDKPVAIVHGDRDDFISADYIESLTYRRLWGGKVHHMHGVGHAPFLEAPQAFNALLLDFANDVFGGE